MMDWYGHNPSPLAWKPNTTDFWETVLGDLIVEHNIMVFQNDATGGYKFQGDGVRLHIPLSFFVDLPNEEIVALVIRGIEVSRSRPDLVPRER